MSTIAELPAGRTRIDRFTVTAPVAQRRHSIVVQARDEDGSFVALKLATTKVGEELAEQEGRVLPALGGEVGCAPRLIAAGSADGRPYSALSWTRGVEVRVAAGELRDGLRVTRVLDLCRRVARAYAAVHERDVIHGQVQPRHVLVDGDGSVGLLDFAVAASGSHVPPAVRLEARFNTLSPPEHAQALLREEDLTLTAAGEQYSVAALLCLLLTGRMYARLRHTREDLARDILDSPPLRLSDHGVDAWPALEEVLGRALEKDPRSRYESMAALADALDDLAPEARTAVMPRLSGVPEPLAQMLGTFRRDASSEEAVARLRPPTCSINFGAAGIAFALTRLGRLTGNEADLERAARWLSVAEERRADADAFDDGDELTRETVGVVSPFHTASGVATARALLSEATGDHERQQAALDEFRAATVAPCANLDLTLGRSAVLLVGAILYAASDSEWPAAQRLAEYGDELCAGIWRDAENTPIAYYGIAHGWAGLAYASLMWARARGIEPHPQVRPALEMLATVAEPLERGCRWPLTPPEGGAPHDYWPGWCHGNAGYVFLWNLARDTYREEAFGQLAERAAWLTDTDVGFSSLCCGSAGQAYAALNHYRSSGDERWYSVARRLAAQSAEQGQLAEDTTSALSLYKGHVGLALLAVELESPERAAMPLFEFEPLRTRQT